ncbi:MAG: hypothetical protein CNLJKLNK_00584 [Holosporales bacterium]
MHNTIIAGMIACQFLNGMCCLTNVNEDPPIADKTYNAKQLKAFNFLSKFLYKDDATSCLEEIRQKKIPQEKLTPAFFNMIERLSIGLRKEDNYLLVKNSFDVDTTKIKEIHYQKIEALKILDPLGLIKTFDFMINLQEDQLSKTFIDIIKKYSKLYFLDDMLNALTYDEILRIPSFNVPKIDNTPHFFRTAKYMLLQEKPIIELERYTAFYKMAYTRLDSFNHLRQDLQLIFIDFCLSHPTFLDRISGCTLAESIGVPITQEDLLKTLNELYQKQNE